MPTAGAVSHFDVNLPILECRVVHVLPNPMIAIGSHRLVQHPVLQQVNNLKHLTDAQGHFSAAFPSGHCECFASHPADFCLDHRQVVMGCVLFHKKPKTLSLKLPLKGNFDQSKIPLLFLPLDGRWLPSYMKLTNMSENSSYDWMKGRILCQTFLH